MTTSEGNDGIRIVPVAAFACEQKDERGISLVAAAVPLVEANLFPLTGENEPVGLRDKLTVSNISLSSGARWEIPEEIELLAGGKEWAGSSTGVAAKDFVQLWAKSTVERIWASDPYDSICVVETPINQGIDYQSVFFAGLVRYYESLRT